MARSSSEQVVDVDGRAVKLTNLTKVLYPETGTTKGDVLHYYAAVAAVMVPHLRQRPATRKRWPDGVGSDVKPGSVFFAKDLAAGTPEWVQRYAIAHRDHDNSYPVVNDRATLTWLGQLAALELHVPQWRFAADGEPQNPDRLVLDLDPGEGVTLADCAEIARQARDVLHGIGHDPYPVTSGSKGIHLYAALDGSVTPDQATELARELALALEAEQPDRVISSMKRADRGGKVFLDWSQNNGNKTTISPYSLRGRAHPTVAAPRTWAELESPDLRQLEYEEVLARIEAHGDLLVDLAGAPDAPDRLSTYRSMRDATKTPEPVPATAPSDRAGQSFVIQEHHARALHYDFRLEHDGVLVSWAVPKAPPTDPGVNRLAVQTEDHPLEYGSFSGDIPAGEYGGGNVKIWDSGSFRLHKWREGKEVIVTCFGQPDGGLGGVRKFALIHTGGGGGRGERNWLMHLMQTDDEDRPSTGSGNEAAPAKIEPMLAALTDPARFGPEGGWAFEMKWDGVRVVAYLCGNQVELRSRRGRDETAAYADVVPSLAALGVGSAVLDGEVVVLDPTGRPSFGLLQNRINLTRPADIQRLAAKYPAQVMLFDLLELDGESLLGRSYDERRSILEELVPQQPGSRLQVPPVFDGDLAAAMATSQTLGLEGVVAKRHDSTYSPGSRGSWRKLKHSRTQEVVVGGWRSGHGRRDGGVGSLLMGVPTEDGLHYVGRVGSGFDDRGLDEIAAALAPLARKASPFLDVPREESRDAHWVEALLVGEVTYGELTGPGRMRHPVWRGLRPDKAPGDVVWERPQG